MFYWGKLLFSSGILAWDLFALCLHVLPVHVCFPSRISGFLPQFKNTVFKLVIWYFLIVLKCKCVCAWLFVLCVSMLPCDELAICPGWTLFSFEPVANCEWSLLRKDGVAVTRAKRNRSVQEWWCYWVTERDTDVKYYVNGLHEVVYVGKYWYSNVKKGTQNFSMVGKGNGGVFRTRIQSGGVK